MSECELAVLHSNLQTDWYLAYSKSRAESVAQDHLQRQDFDTWSPKIKVANKKSPEPAFVFETLFPRYVFFRPRTAHQSIGSVRYTCGVSNIVTFGTEPARIGHKKLCQLSNWVLKQHQTSMTDISGMKPGTLVKITEGPFSNLQGLVKMSNSRRILVLLEIMGSDQTISFPYSAVHAA